MHIIRTPKGTRLLGGHISDLPPGTRFVVFLKPYPEIRFRFSTVREPGSSAVLERGKQWQAAFPVRQTGMPADLFVTADDTRKLHRRDGDEHVFEFPERCPAAVAERYFSLVEHLYLQGGTTVETLRALQEAVRTADQHPELRSQLNIGGLPVVDFLRSLFADRKIQHLIGHRDTQEAAAD